MVELLVADLPVDPCRWDNFWRIRLATGSLPTLDVDFARHLAYFFLTASGPLAVRGHLLYSLQALEIF